MNNILLESQVSIKVDLWDHPGWNKENVSKSSLFYLLIPEFFTIRVSCNLLLTRISKMVWRISIYWMLIFLGAKSDELQPSLASKLRLKELK